MMMQRGVRPLLGGLRRFSCRHVQQINSVKTWAPERNVVQAAWRFHVSDDRDSGREAIPGLCVSVSVEQDNAVCKPLDGVQSVWRQGTFNLPCSARETGLMPTSFIAATLLLLLSQKKLVCNSCHSCHSCALLQCHPQTPVAHTGPDTTQTQSLPQGTPSYASMESLTSKRLSTTGRAKAKVLPLPVLARPIRSRPSEAGLKTAFWMANNAWMPRFSRARMVSGQRPRLVTWEGRDRLS